MTATKVAITTAPSSSSPDATVFSTQPVAQLQDANGNAVAFGGSVITASITAGGGTLTGGTVVTTASNGAASFTTLSIAGTIGPRTLTFSSPGLTSATASVTLTPGPAAAVAVNSGNNQSAVVGAAVTTAPSVKITDADGNAVAGVAVIFAVASGGGSVNGSSQTTNAAGIATVGSWTLGTTLGPNTLTATAAGLFGSPITFNATVALAFQSLAAGQGHTCGLAINGAAYCWGDNSFGALGDGTSTDRANPVLVLGGLTFRTLVAGSRHTCGLVLSGAAYCWGYAGQGELGDGTIADVSVRTPVAVVGGLTFENLSAKFNHTCGITTGGIAYCWGYNQNGQLGDGTETSRSSPVAVAGSLTFVNVTTGTAHTCGVTAGGPAYCWGLNTYGQLGDGGANQVRLSPVQVIASVTFRYVAPGGGPYSCGLTVAGAAYCWGWNPSGQLGDGTSSPHSAPSAVNGSLAFQSVSTGNNYACGITIAGAGYCWGENPEGQLGNGAVSDRLTPFPVAGGQTFQSLTTGIFHACGVATGGAASCWGWNYYGQLGNGTTLNISSTPTPVR